MFSKVLILHAILWIRAVHAHPAICDADSLLMNGRWAFLDERVRSDPSYCPQTFLQMMDDRHSREYACRGSTRMPFRHAQFIDTAHSTHSIQSSQVSIHDILKRDKISVSFVGDSTVQQIFWAFACELERYVWLEKAAAYDISANWTWTGGDSLGRVDSLFFEGVEIWCRFSACCATSATSRQS